MAGSDRRESKMAENESLNARSVCTNVVYLLNTLFFVLCWLSLSVGRGEIYRLPPHRVNQSMRITGWMAMNVRVARTYHGNNTISLVR